MSGSVSGSTPWPRLKRRLAVDVGERFLALLGMGNSPADQRDGAGAAGDCLVIGLDRLVIAPEAKQGHPEAVEDRG